MGAASDAIRTAKVNNSYFRITEFKLPASAALELRQSSFKRILLPITPGELLVDSNGQEVNIEIVAGQPVDLKDNAAIKLFNTSDREIRFTLIVLKS